MLWQEIVRLSLLGTERVTFPESVTAFLEKWELDKEDEANAILLNLIATLGTAERVQLPLKEADGTVERLAFTESLPKTTKTALQSLKMMLEGPFEKALPEFIQLLKEHQQLLPRVYLPEIFYWSVKNKKYWSQLLPFIGNFGQWLLQQNPDWKTLTTVEDPDSWQKFDKEEKLRLLASLRKTNPEKSIQLLSSGWEKEHYKDKQSFLKVLYSGLSKADIPFLELAKEDSRKEVRMVATELLTSLPVSEISKEIFSIFSPFVEKHSTYLQINYERPGEAINDFFAAHPIQVPLLGNSLRLSRVAFFIGRIHPDKWLEHFGMEAGEFLYYIRRGSQKREWTLGLIEAYLRFKPASWALPLLTFWLENAGEYIWSELPMDKFSKTLTREQVEYAIAFKREGKGFLIEEKSPEAIILLHSELPWSTKLTNYILLNFRAWVNQVNTIRWDMFHYQEILRAAAYRVSTENYDDLRKDWNQNGAGWQMWANEMESFFSIMEFRRKMRAGI